MQVKDNLRVLIERVVLEKYAERLTKQDKRRMDAYAEELSKSQVPDVNHIYGAVVSVVKNALAKGKVEHAFPLVEKYFLENDMLKLVKSGKSSVRLDIGFEDYRNLVKGLQELFPEKEVA